MYFLQIHFFFISCTFFYLIHLGNVDDHYNSSCTYSLYNTQCVSKKFNFLKWRGNDTMVAAYIILDHCVDIS